MKCIYCNNDIFLTKKETVVHTYYWYECGTCGFRTPKGMSIKYAKRRMELLVVFVKNETIFRIGDKIKCEFDKEEITGILQFDEVALCYVCEPQKGIRYPMWECTFVEKV